MSELSLLKLCIWLCRKSGKDLELHQQQLLLAALRGERLRDIEIHGFSPNYISRVVAPNLWRQLSQYCDQKVTIRRLQIILRQQYDKLTPEEQLAVEAIQPLLDGGIEANVSPENFERCRIPPNVNAFYNHEQTLNIFHHALNQGSLLFVYGSPGIGKTSLVSHALSGRSPDWGRIVWCNLGENTDFQWWFGEICQCWDLAPSPRGAIADLEAHLEEQNVILIFDHWELLFSPKHLSGTYQPQHEPYGNFLKTIAAAPNLTGKVIVITREIAPSMTQLIERHDKTLGIESPPLNHDAAQKILAEYDLNNPELWLDFVKTYCGNPFNLRLVSTCIKEWYGGSITNFHQQNTVIGGDTLQNALAMFIERITDQEKDILYWLMLWSKPISVTELQLVYSKKVIFESEVLNAIRSLKRRFLLEKNIYKNPPVISLQPSIHRYLFKNFVTVCATEFSEAIKEGFDPYRLYYFSQYDLRGQVSDQGELILVLILKLLQEKYRNPETLKQHLDNLEFALQDMETDSFSYALSNIQALKQQDFS